MRDVGGLETTGGMMDSMTINGVEFVQRSSVPEVVDSEHVCVIATNGWIFEGHCVEREDGCIKLAGASVVRRWDNGLGIGGIAKAEHKDDYTLDACGTVRVHAVVAEIALEW